MNYYKSPSIQMFETAGSAVEPLVSGPGVATVGFSTRGPMNELLHFRSYEEFERMMGKPVAEYPRTHLMAKRIFNTGAGTMYFVRAGNEYHEDYGAEKATVWVTNSEGAKFGRYFWNTDIDEGGGGFKGFLTINEGMEGTLVIKVTIGGETIEEAFEIPTKIKKEAEINRKVIHLDTIVSKFNGNSLFSSKAVMKKSLDDLAFNTVNGIYIETKNYKDTVDIDFSNIDGDVVAGGISGSLGISLENGDDGEFKGLLGDPDEGSVSDDFLFIIEAKNPGSGMNGVSVIKKDDKVSLSTSEKTFTLEVIDVGGKVLESYSKLKLDNFIERINDKDFGSKFIFINTDIEGEDNDFEKITFVDGTYVLGKGTLLPGGFYAFKDGDYKPEEGTDGVPTRENEEYTYVERISELFVNALNEPALLNMDNVFFSLIATPDSQNSEVQDAAISVASRRGDAFYVADAPLEFSQDKSTIPLAINWHNGVNNNIRGTAFSSSYAGIYYGWTTVLNEFTGTNITIPPSVVVIPEFLVVDANDGVYNSPVGAKRGRVIAYDYLYSPDMEDREAMMGGDNCINPIIYSNTRGLMIFGQKTADRTGSALNRINIRRMTNRIKSQLFTSLDVIRFELNNSTTREKARTIASNILLSYRNAGAIEGYTVDVQTPGGAERDVVNIYIDFIPVGLVERIRVFINITEGGLQTTEG